MKGLLILGLRKHSYGYLWLLFMANITVNLNRPFSYSEKESQSNDTLLHFVEFSNVHNSDRSPNATRSNVAYKNV